MNRAAVLCQPPNMRLPEMGRHAEVVAIQGGPGDLSFTYLPAPTLIRTEVAAWKRQGRDAEP
jgi:hypothetical protein